MCLQTTPAVAGVGVRFAGASAARFPTKGGVFSGKRKVKGDIQTGGYWQPAAAEVSVN